MTALHLRILGSTAGNASNLPTTSLQPRDTSIGVTFDGSPDQVLSAFLEYFNALQGEELRIEMLVDRRGVQRTEGPNAMNALDHGMPILFYETPLARKRAIHSKA
jgi:hypothetical protein